ncbi:MAG: DUF1919 domain-containing protein [Bacilli bacterium]|nr:DUF1919 domain-containing protein [Bacilli bacterium]
MIKKEGNNVYWFVPGRAVPFLVNKAKQKRKIFLEKKSSKPEHADFSLICNNCIAGAFYHDYGLEFKSPFIDVFIESDDFFKLMRNFKHYIIDVKKMVDITGKNDFCPVGLLGDIKIRFVHYKDFSTASEKWFARAKRINFDHLFFLMSDIDWDGKAFSKFVNKSQLEDFLNENKTNFIFVTNDLEKKQMKNNNVVFLKKYANNKPFYFGALELFGRGRTCLERYFDVANWINQNY